jgi:hypothetical protein
MSDFNDLKQSEADSLSHEVACAPVRVAKSFSNDTVKVVNVKAE